jgi:hypothetical protein
LFTLLIFTDYGLQASCQARTSGDGDPISDASHVIQEFEVYALPEFEGRLDESFAALESELQGQPIRYVRHRFAGAAREVYRSIMVDFARTRRASRACPGQRPRGQESQAQISNIEEARSSFDDPMSSFPEPFFENFTFGLPNTSDSLQDFAFDTNNDLTQANGDPNFLESSFGIDTGMLTLNTDPPSRKRQFPCLNDADQPEKYWNCS